MASLADLHPASTLWATAQGVVARHARGDERVDAVWTEAEHQAAWQALQQPVQLRRGVLACRIDDAIVVRRAPLAAPSLEALAQSGMASLLALRTLAAALRLGRNIVWTGPQAACDAAMTSLAAQGRRAGIWAMPLQAPVPPHFVAVCDASAVWGAGIDRLIAPGSTPQEALAMLGAQTSAQAWICAGGLERALMRLELATGQAASEAAVQLLAAVDLVVVVQGHQVPHITHIAELTLVETGYRPALLFATGHALAPQALVPVQAPSFVPLLADLGEQALAADLTHAVQPSAPLASSRPAAAPASAPAVRPQAPPKARPRPKPAPMQSAASESQPGWELDRLLEMQPDEPALQDPVSGGFDGQRHAAEAAEAASLAAQFGLGPPPPPRARPTRPSAFDEVLQQTGGGARDLEASPNEARLADNAHAGHLGAPEDGTDDDEGPAHGGFNPGGA